MNTASMSPLNTAITVLTQCAETRIGNIAILYQSLSQNYGAKVIRSLKDVARIDLAKCIFSEVIKWLDK